MRKMSTSLRLSLLERESREKEEKLWALPHSRKKNPKGRKKPYGDKEREASQRDKDF